MRGEKPPRWLDGWPARQAHPNLSLLKSVKRQTSQTDDLQFTRTWFTSEVVRDLM